MENNYYNRLDLTENTNVKVAFLDFDDSICIHINKKRIYENWFEAQVKHDLNYYLNKEKYLPMPGIKYLLKRLEKLNIPTFGLTCTEYSTVAPLKLNFVHYYYGNHMQEMICVGKKKSKIEFIKNYCKVHNISVENVLLIDDNNKIIHFAIDAGINIRTPQEICACYGKLETNGENL